MNVEDFIILLLSFLIIFLIIKNKSEKFETMNNSGNNSGNNTSNNTGNNTDNKEILSTNLDLLGYKLMPVPNFYEIFGSNKLDTVFEFPGNNNWKLFTNTKPLEYEGLASLISSTNPPFYNFDDKIRLTGFSKKSTVIGLMTPSKISPSGQWLKGFEWYGVSRLGEDKNAKDVIVWANHKKSTDIKLNSEGLVDDAVKLLQFHVPQEASLAGSIFFNINDYKTFNHPPFTTYYFQILNNWGNKENVKVNSIVPYFEI